jgi:hypothetical protein
VKGTDLAALRTKYEEMLRLRAAASAGVAGDPRREMAALATRFPGALREIDDLPLDTIRERVRDLHDAEKGGTVAEWMTATHLFHSLTRGALCAKRWLGGRRSIDEATLAEFDRDADALNWGEDTRGWRADLPSLASPPRGRLTELVYRRVGSVLGMNAESARTLIFGAPRRGGARF